MNTLINVKSALGKEFVKLSGPENYDIWLRGFEPIAHVNDFLGLYLGTDDVIGKPSPPEVSKAPESHCYLLAIHNAQLQDWKDNNNTVRFACALLRAAVESWIWKELSAEDALHPNRAWNAIAASNKVPDIVRRERSLVKLNNIKLTDPCALQPVLNQFEDVYWDISDAGGTFSRSQLITKINAALPHPYKCFITGWESFCRDVPVDEFADANKDRWEVAKERDRFGHTPFC